MAKEISEKHKIDEVEYLYTSKTLTCKEREMHARRF
jgi:hypothetical protein